MLSYNAIYSDKCQMNYYVQILSSIDNNCYTAFVFKVYIHNFFSDVGCAFIKNILCTINMPDDQISIPTLPYYVIDYMF